MFNVQEQEERDYFPETPQMLDLQETRMFGYRSPEREYLLTDYDVWVKNPHYQGEPGPHPEEDWD